VTTQLQLVNIIIIIIIYVTGGGGGCCCCCCCCCCRRRRGVKWGYFVTFRMTWPPDQNSSLLHGITCNNMASSSLNCWGPCRNTRKRKHVTRCTHILDVWASYGKQHNDITYLWQSCTATVNNSTILWPVRGPAQSHLRNCQWMILKGKIVLTALLIRRPVLTGTQLKPQHFFLTLSMN